MAMNYRIPAAAVIGLATSAIHLAAKLIPHERIVYRVEDEEGNTVGVFSSARKAARAGGNVVEEIVDPRVYDAYEVKLTPLGDPISRKRISSREPIRDDAYALGLDGQCEVAIVGVSAVSVVVADALAREGLEAFNQELAKIGSRMCYAFGRLHTGREGFGLIWDVGDQGRLFKSSRCAVSNDGFEQARNAYRS